MKTIIQKAGLMTGYLVEQRRTDGSKYWSLKEGKHYEALQDIMFKCHLDRMPCDDIYSRVVNLLDCVVGYDEYNDDTNFEVIDSCIPAYTSDLTFWLNTDNRNIEYLTQALQWQGCDDGPDVLRTAMYLFYEEIAQALFAGLENWDV